MFAAQEFCDLLIRFTTCTNFTAGSKTFLMIRNQHHIDQGKGWRRVLPKCASLNREPFSEAPVLSAGPP